MAHTRRVTRAVNALNTQRRIILWLECGHKLSIGWAQVEADHDLNHYLKAEQAVCYVCPNPAPTDERIEKTPQQLWKEAGEP